MEKTVMLVVGTRPEAIKLALLYKKLKSSGINVLLCATFQHEQLLASVLKIFNITPDVACHVMQRDQGLNGLLVRVVSALDAMYDQHKPSLVVVQGDTTTAMGAALAAFHKHIPVVHVEAGLRTGNIFAPYPEEMNRIAISACTSYHCAPTSLSVAHLLAQGIPRQAIFLTGNTIVDVLNWMNDQLRDGAITIHQDYADFIARCKQQYRFVILLTVHRRESFGDGIHKILSAIKSFIERRHDVVIIYPCHPNPAVSEAIEREGLSSVSNIVMLAPLSYEEFVYTMGIADWIVSDSGGVQEEAVSLGKKILVLRDCTERMEGIWDGAAVMAGIDDQAHIIELLDYLYEQATHLNPPVRSLIYGDGTASEKIIALIQSVIEAQSTQHVSRDVVIHAAGVG